MLEIFVSIVNMISADLANSVWIVKFKWFNQSPRPTPYPADALDIVSEVRRAANKPIIAPSLEAVPSVQNSSAYIESNADRLFCAVASPIC